MTRLSLDKNVTQNLITFHIGPPRKPQRPDENALNEIVSEGEVWWYFELILIPHLMVPLFPAQTCPHPHQHSCHGQLRHQTPISLLGKD